MLAGICPLGIKKEGEKEEARRNNAMHERDFSRKLDFFSKEAMPTLPILLLEWAGSYSQKPSSDFKFRWFQIGERGFGFLSKANSSLAHIRGLMGLKEVEMLSYVNLSV